jgi:hypothetical protein
MRDSFLFGLPTDSVTLPEGAALSYFHPERSEGYPAAHFDAGVLLGIDSLTKEGAEHK